MCCVCLCVWNVCERKARATTAKPLYQPMSTHFFFNFSPSRSGAGATGASCTRYDSEGSRGAPAQGLSPPLLRDCCLFKSMCSYVSRQTCGCTVHPYCLRFFFLTGHAADFFFLFCAAFRERASEALRCGARAEGGAVSFLCGHGCQLEEGLTRHVHSRTRAMRTRIEEYEDTC